MRGHNQRFARMLAKIALGLAVAKFGISGFEPLVRDLILNKPEEYGHWVGGFAGSQAAVGVAIKTISSDSAPGRPTGGIWGAHQLRGRWATFVVSAWCSFKSRQGRRCYAGTSESFACTAIAARAMS